MSTTVSKRVPPGASGGATKRVTALASGGATSRITGAITADTTPRVPEDVIGLGPFLLLEGDHSGALRLETTKDDDPTGYLKLQGDY